MLTTNFIATYGTFDLFWTDVYHVKIKYEDGIYNTVCYDGNAVIFSELSFIFDESTRQHVLHGTYKYNYLLRRYKYGVLHAEGCPAEIRTVNGNCIYEAWYKDGVLHREDGPATTDYIIIGVGRYKWYYHGKEYKPLTKKAVSI